jgi:hypothetical protein
MHLGQPVCQTYILIFEGRFQTRVQLLVVEDRSFLFEAAAQFSPVQTIRPSQQLVVIPQQNVLIHQT